MTQILSSSEIKKHIECFTAMNMETESHGRFITVLHGYGKREGLLDNISGIMYRVWNAVKSLFGQSDWQVAKDFITKENKARCPFNRIFEDFNISDKLRNKITTFIDSSARKGTEILLQVLVDTTYETDLATLDQLDSFISEKLAEECNELEIETQEFTEFLERELDEQM